MGLFGSKGGAGSGGPGGARETRHSSGWAQLLKHLQTENSLRVLDIGPTSAGNINFITGLGHSIYMANLAEDAGRPEYRLPAGEKTGPSPDADFDVAAFLAQNLDFSGRTFDIVLLWDTADYMPRELVQPVIDRLCEVLHPAGKLLAYFHNKTTGEETAFTRYHLSPTDEIGLQRLGGQPLVATYSNRQVEGQFKVCAAYKFFLAKDALREVLVTR